MKKTVSFETANRLKEAGFAQPEPEFGQFWYASNGTLCIASRDGIYPGEITVVVDSGKTLYLERSYLVFAPTATDILEHLGENFVQWFDKSPKIQKWFCCTGDSFSDAGHPFMHKNPHEAAALAWLSIQEIQKK